jgi:hypothetical protein
VAQIKIPSLEGCSFIHLVGISLGLCILLYDVSLLMHVLLVPSLPSTWSFPHIEHSFSQASSTGTSEIGSAYGEWLGR